MTAQPRLAFLLETVGLEAEHLVQTNQRLFALPFDAARTARKLRNRMVHEYVRNAGELADALNEAHTLVPLLTGFAQAVARFCQARGLA